MVGVEVRGYQNQGVRQFAATALRRPALCELLQSKADSLGSALSNAG